MYGLIVYTQAIIGYLAIFVSFGFNTTATKDISIYRNDSKQLSQIVSSVLIIKFLLLIISFLILIILTRIIPQMKDYWLLYCLTMWLVLYEFMFPIWYFQGIEKMKYITILTLISRALFVTLIFIFIKSSKDYLMVPILNGLGSFIAGGISLFIIFKCHKIKFHLPKKHILAHYFKESIPLFISSASVSVFVQANKILIGSFIGFADVAYYDITEKIVQLLKMPQIIITQVIFPKTSRDKNAIFIKRMMIISITLAFILFVFTQIFDRYIIFLVAGSYLEPAIKLLRIFSVVILIVYISQYTSVHTLLANGFNKIWMTLMISSGVIYLILVSTLGVCKYLTTINLVYATIISEVYMLISSYYFSKKNNLL
jgi:Membrane protein involved in the export of O-antigen and teichoic acid